MSAALRVTAVLLAGAAALGERASPPVLPLKEGSLRFAVLGNTGVGRVPPDLVHALAESQERTRFDLVLLTGDNISGEAAPAAFREKFEEPFEDLRAAAVRFQAVLGNDDDPAERTYQGFNMGGRRYYSFKPAHADVRFFALDSTYMDEEQLRWLDTELAGAGESWKIVFLHHPPYGSEPNSPGEALRPALEPLLVRHGVAVVFAGHEYAYARLPPRSGIHYFVSGAGGGRRGGGGGTEVAARFTGPAFLVCEIEGGRLHFEARTAKERIVDSGTIERPGARPGEKK